MKALPTLGQLVGGVTCDLPVLMCTTCARPVAWLKLESQWDGWFPLYEYRVRRTRARGSCLCISAGERLRLLGPTLQVGSGLPHHLVPKVGLSWEVMRWEVWIPLLAGRWQTPIADRNAEHLREALGGALPNEPTR